MMMTPVTFDQREVADRLNSMITSLYMAYNSAHVVVPLALIYPAQIIEISP